MTDQHTDDVSTYNYNQPEDKSQPGFVRYLVIGLVALIAFIVIALIIALIVAATAPQGGVATGFQVVRDVLIILLAIQGIFVSVALVILVIQVSSFIRLMQTEVQPMIQEFRQAAATTKGTAQFVGKNVAAPVIKAASVMAGAQAFLGEITGLRRNTSSRK